jgi:alkanesulfonate monooxygenase SsuD/methylene tetrahydromethanopterin reductase-like flavin-dependent oxidoreductase (luciferase family)
MFSGDPGRVLEAAREAEALGFDGTFVFDHFFPPGAAPDRPSLEAFTILGAVAAATERVTIGPLVTRVSLRPVGLLAKTVAWLDQASEGRMVLGVGTGDPIDQPEHEAFGIPMLGKEERRAHLDEAVRALKALFAGRRFEGGAHVPVLEGPLLPPPAQPGGPPVWIGAQADAVVRMAGRIADGWNGWGMTAERFAGKAAILADEAATAGRTVEATWAGIALVGEDESETEALLERRRKAALPMDIWSGTAEALSVFLKSLEEAGSTWAVLVLAGPKDRAGLIAREVLPALDRKAVG